MPSYRITSFIPQFGGTCSIEIVWRATVQYGAVLNCPIELSYCTLPEVLSLHINKCFHVIFT